MFEIIKKDSILVYVLSVHRSFVCLFRNMSCTRIGKGMFTREVRLLMAYRDDRHGNLLDVFALSCFGSGLNKRFLIYRRSGSDWLFWESCRSVSDYRRIIFMRLLYRGKEKIHSEIKLIIYQLKWYSPTCIISLVLLVLRPKLVLLLTDVLQSYRSASLSASASPCLRDTASFILPRYRKSLGTSHYTIDTIGSRCVKSIEFRANSCRLFSIFSSRTLYYQNGYS